MKRALKFLCLASTFLITGAAAVADDRDDGHAPTATPVKHLVVIFQENVSYDHYFGTYPHALNLPRRDAVPCLAVNAYQQQPDYAP